jgi:hypothetical protein
MHSSDLYRKYRQRIEELANEACPTQLSLTTLRALLQEFEREAAALTPGVAHFVCDEIANQLEHEALHSTSRHRRDILLAAVKSFDGMVVGRPRRVY